MVRSQEVGHENACLLQKKSRIENDPVSQRFQRASFTEVRSIKKSLQNPFGHIVFLIAETNFSKKMERKPNKLTMIWHLQKDPKR